MDDFGIMRIAVPTSKRKHTFYKVSIGGKFYWYDNTETAKLKAFDSVKLYQQEDNKLVFKRYIRKGLL